jgi:hypothetical protein
MMEFLLDSGLAPAIGFAVGIVIFMVLHARQQ